MTGTMMSEKTRFTSEEVESRYHVAPPIIQTAISAILRFEEELDPMGYDISYFQEDLPAVVTKAIKPWEGM